MRAAADRATPEEVARLRATLEAQAQAIDDPDAFIAADMRFHTQIAAISGNPIFEAVSEAMLGWLRQYHTEMLSWTGRQNVTLTEHAEILEHIAHHRPEEAEQAMIRHLDRSSSLYIHGE